MISSLENITGNYNMNELIEKSLKKESLAKNVNEEMMKKIIDMIEMHY